jgi:hypothetical protein
LFLPGQDDARDCDHDTRGHEKTGSLGKTPVDARSVPAVIALLVKCTTSGRIADKRFATIIDGQARQTATNGHENAADSVGNNGNTVDRWTAS